MLLGDLTEREREILQLLAQGMRNDDIAAKLFISPQTVQTHVRNILGKLRVHSKLEAVAFAVQARRDHRLVEPASLETSCPAGLKSRSRRWTKGVPEREPRLRAREAATPSMASGTSRRPERTPPWLGPSLSCRDSVPAIDGQRACAGPCRSRSVGSRRRGCSSRGSLEPREALAAVVPELLEGRRVVGARGHHPRADVRAPVRVGAARRPPRRATWGGCRALARPPRARSSPRPSGSGRRPAVDR